MDRILYIIFETLAHECRYEVSEYLYFVLVCTELKCINFIVAAVSAVYIYIWSCPNSRSADPSPFLQKEPF